MYVLALQTVLTDSLEALRRHAPTLLTFAVLLLVGWLSGKLLSGWTRRLIAKALGRFDPAVGEALERTGAVSTVPRVIGGFVFWVVLLIFVAAAIDTLGLAALTDSLNQLVYYLPNAVAAILVVLAGVIGGAFARSAVARSAAAAAVPRSDVVARAVQVTVVTIALVVALEQVGVSGRLLVILVAIVVGTMFAGAAMAFGLGARTTVSNIVASYYVVQSYRIGQRIRIGGADGRIIRTTPTAVVLDTSEGQVTIPAHRFAEEPSMLLPEHS
jgi:hypothetical protein